MTQLLLSGDVMTGRGIDQVLPHPSDPRIHESWIRSAESYVALAERRNGRIPRGVEWAYPWGEMLAVMEHAAPDARIVNLETAVTRSDDWLPKGINYRMHPDNVPCLTAAGIDCCVLANNHVLDWGVAGLEETLDALHGADLRTAGAGRNAAEAARPAILELPGGGRVLVFAFATASSGVPSDWAAGPERPGVNLFDENSADAASLATSIIEPVRRDGDLVVVSIHWGPNWSYPVSRAQRRLAHVLIDRAGVNVVHGHSSHHVRGLEVHHGRLILYGCGDLITDYEGIRGHEAFRGDLGLLYFCTLDERDGALKELRMTPTRMQRFQLTRPGDEDIGWLSATLNREGDALGTRIRAEGPDLLLEWSEAA